MANFKSIWNQVLPTNNMPSAVVGISEATINNYLSAHRIYDKEMYERIEPIEDEDTGKVFFKLHVIVGANKSDHKKNKGTPLKLNLVDPKGVKQLIGKNEVVYTYPASEDSSKIRISNDHPANVILDIKNVHFYMSWPSSSSGTPWEFNSSPIDFQLEAYLELDEVDASSEYDNKPVSQTVLRIIPLKLRVSKPSLNVLSNNIKEAASANRVDICDDKLNDLIFSLITFSATQIGPDLADSATIPVVQMQNFDLYPSLLIIKSKTINVGASLSPSREALDNINRIKRQISRYGFLIEEDIANAGGIEKILYTSASLKKYYRLPDSARLKGAKFLKLRSETEIEKSLKLSSEFTKALTREIKNLVDMRLSEPNIDVRPDSTGRANMSKVKNGMAVAINEFFLDTLVSQYGNTIDEDETKVIKVLDLIKGKLGYRVVIGSPNISISNKGVTGEIFINMWAGLYYSIKSISKCSFKWSSWKRIGIGIKGVPKLTLATKKSKGVSLKATFNLSKLKLHTGAGFPIDDLLGAVSKFVLKPVELFLNGVAFLLSFVIIPANFSPKNQKTILSISKAVTSQYKRVGGPSDSTNNYLFVSVTTQGRKKA